MIAYCTVQDVKLALAPVSDWADDSLVTSLSDQQFVDAIDEAEGTIRAFLRKRYTIVPTSIDEELLPISEPTTITPRDVAPAPLRSWTRDIAAFLATLTHRKGRDIKEDDPVRLRYNMVIGYLTAVRDHKMDLNLPDVTDDVDSTGDVTVVNQYEGQLFDLTDLGLGIDSSHYQRFEPYRNQWS